MSAKIHRLPTAERPEDAVLAAGKTALKKAYKPPPKVLQEWKSEEQRREDPGYAARWTAYWGKTVRAVASFGGIAAIDMTWVDEYVRRCRLAELHMYEATREPYVTYESGYVVAHPGFAQSRSEAKEARQLAAELGLTPKSRREAGVDAPRPDEVPSGSSEWADDQTGPDGEPL